MGSRAIFKDPFVKASKFYHFSAERSTVGALAAHLARIVCGKHKPVFNPAVDCGDNVVVTEVEKIAFTGKKYYQKHYRWHTGYPGGLVEYPVRRMFERHPQRVLWKAVYGMLPKNRLRRERMQRLRLFIGDEHPYKHILSPLPEHLKFVVKLPPEPTEEDLMQQPGYWVEFKETADGVELETTVQQQEAIPKRIPRSGLYKKGKKPDDISVLKPVEQIEWLSEVVKIAGTNVESAPVGNSSSSSSSSKK